MNRPRPFSIVRNLLVPAAFTLAPWAAQRAIAQPGECLIGGCATGILFGDVQSTTSNSFVNSEPGTWAGEYNAYSVTAGQQYEWSLCVDDGALNPTGDTQLTLKSSSGVDLCYSDDVCGLASKILWTAAFTGEVWVQINQYNCQTNTNAHTVRWRCVSCPNGAPPNDACGSAAIIGVNAACVPTQGTTQNASQSLPPATCSTFTASAANDVWYTFIAIGASTTIQVTGDGDATTGMDPILQAYSGACGNLVSLGCVDATLRGGTETLTIATVPGTTYYYRVYYWPYSAPQTVFGFATCVVGQGTTPPPNDACANAASLVVNALCIGTAGTTLAAGQSLPPSLCGGFTAPNAYDVWYAFTAVGTSTTVQVTGSGSAGAGGMDPVLEAYGGTCGNLVSLGCADATFEAGTETLTIPTTPGTTYYYRVYYWPYPGQTEFGFTTCAFGSGGPTPPNDLCGNTIPAALAIGGSVSFSGNNLNATSTGDFGPDYPFDPQPTVWHAFTTAECANVTVSYCATSPAFGNVYLYLSADCPANDNLVDGTYSFEVCPDNIVVYFSDLPAGTWYLPVLLDPINNAAGPYAITVSAAACSYCGAGALSVDPLTEKISNVTFAGINNSSTSANGYEDFTAVSASVVAGIGYTISVTVSSPWATDQVLAWIDWDQSQTFEGSELVFASPIGTGPFAGTVTVPLTAAPGPTRMRVRLHDTYIGSNYANTPNATPCGISTYGQVEDYTVDVIGIITGVGSAEAPALSVRPNPSDGDMTVTAGPMEGRVLIEVLDATGRVAWSDQRAVAQGAPIELGLRGRLAAGSYVLRISNEAQRMEQRIVVH